MNLLAPKQLFLSVILSVIGLAVWIIISSISNKAEAWDNNLYYVFGLPIMFIAAAIAGFIAPDKPWRWGTLVVILQPVALFIQVQPGPFILVGIFFFLVFMAIGIGCAYIGKLVRSLVKQ